MKLNDGALRHVLYIDGLLLLMLSAAMAVPIAVDYQSGNTDWMVFVASAAVTAFVGGLLALACQGSDAQIDHRAGYLLTVSAWLVVGVFASLPLYSRPCTSASPTPSSRPCRA